MKKLIMLSLAILLCTSLVACGDKTDTLSTPSAKENDSTSNKNTRTETYVIQDETLKQDVEELKEQVSSIAEKVESKSLDDLYAETEKKYKPQIEALEKRLNEEVQPLYKAKKEEYNKAVKEYSQFIADNISTSSGFFETKEELKAKYKAIEKELEKFNNNELSKELDNLINEWNKENEEIKKRVGN